METEQYVTKLKERFALKSVHIFDYEDRHGYRCFAFRKHAKGFNASVAEGAGDSILGCLTDLEDSLVIGPIKANEKKARRDAVL